MVDDAMAAYANEDVEACFAIDAMCEEASGAAVQDLVESEIEEVTSGQDIEKLMSEVSRLRLTIRGLERIGDHAVSIAARTLYHGREWRRTARRFAPRGCCLR